MKKVQSREAIESDIRRIKDIIGNAMITPTEEKKYVKELEDL